LAKLQQAVFQVKSGEENDEKIQDGWLYGLTSLFLALLGDENISLDTCELYFHWFLGDVRRTDRIISICFCIAKGADRCLKL